MQNMQTKKNNLNIHTILLSKGKSIAFYTENYEINLLFSLGKDIVKYPITFPGPI